MKNGKMPTVTIEQAQKNFCKVWALVLLDLFKWVDLLCFNPTLDLVQLDHSLLKCCLWNWSVLLLCFGCISNSIAPPLRQWSLVFSKFFPKWVFLYYQGMVIFSPVLSVSKKLFTSFCPVTLCSSWQLFLFCVLSYCGAQIFEIYGLGTEVVDFAFRGSISKIGGLTFDEVTSIIWG